MEQFKVRKGQKPVRLASTSGHVTWVRDEWTDVPDELVNEALKSRCIPKDLYDSMQKEVVGGPEGGEGGGEGDNDPDPNKERIAAILAALDRINTEVEAGKEKTESGRGLLTAKNAPSVDAVAEYSGLTDVSRAEIDGVLE